MRINTEMQTILEQLRLIEGRTIKRLMSLPANDLGNGLIDVYYKRKNLRTRELIREFLDQAGIVWLRKLLTRDTGPVVSSQGRFASLDEYLDLLAANDDVAGLVSNA